MFPKNQIICLISLVIFITACSDKPLTREEQIRQFIEAGVNAAENRDHNDLAEMIDDEYQDQKALTRTQLVKLIKLYFFRHKNIYLFTKINEIDFPAEDEASVDLHVAMAGSVISDTSALLNLRAKIYRFELELIKRDDWQLREASWYPASMADMQ